MDKEPSILDYLKSHIRQSIQKIIHPPATSEEPVPLQTRGINDRLNPRISKDADMAEVTSQTYGAGQTEIPLQTRKTDPVAAPEEKGIPAEEEKVEASAPTRLPLSGIGTLFSRWRSWLAFVLALVAQLSLQPHQGVERQWQTGVLFYILSGLLLVWSIRKNEWILTETPAGSLEESQDKRFLRSSFAFLASLAFSLIAFFAFKGGLFKEINLILWFLSLILMIWAFWQPEPGFFAWWNRLKAFFSHLKWNFKLDGWALLVLAAYLLVIFFRTYRLVEVPSQMVSDHAEKLLDISRIFGGLPYVFFANNGGREFFQFYLTAAIVLVFKTGLTFMSLKIGTVLAGLVAVIYIYLLGKEVGNRRVGLLAMVLVGIAYWPNVISRFGLRLPMYPLFYAAALYYLMRGLRTRNRNYFIFSGLALGLGLNGYTAFRITPLVILVAVGLYLLHRQSQGFRRQAVWGLFAIIVISFILFIPLLRYIIDNPSGALFRSLSRLGNLERPLPGAPVVIFLNNFWRSLTMFSWEDGTTWPISITNIPALDVISAALFTLGIILLAFRYIRHKHWVDIFTLVSIPLLMMPSILALAFPIENPSLSRSGAAMIPVFLVIGLALDGLLKAIESISASIVWKRLAWLVGLFLVAGASQQNYDLVFNQYRQEFDASSWNTTEIGQVVRGFSLMEGTTKTQWVVAYPYWVDTRLVMINAGFPTEDDYIMPDKLSDSLAVPGLKMFILKKEDTDSLETLRTLYPAGWVNEYASEYPDKNFLIFLAPPQSP
jgi:hypothetical protein